jgi:(1->4)-alpha-D-glucan 1-alpha-D-glucosylmutase
VTTAVSPHVPSATYRVQLGPAMGFAEAAELVPYLQSLGISDFYSSPVLQARRGSTHGYDVTDPTRLSAELGGEAGFESLVARLHHHGMGLLLDIVPNHMAATAENPWWADLLRFGQSSPFARFFDVDWDPPYSPIKEKVLVAMLGRPYGQVLEGGELRVALEKNGFVVRYWERSLPLDPGTTAGLLRAAAARLTEQLGADERAAAELAELAGLMETLPERSARDAAAQAARRRWQSTGQPRLWSRYVDAPAVRAAIDHAAARLSGRKGEPASFDPLDGVLRAQAFRLGSWRSAREKLNYRRFFNINDLASLRMQDAVVFDACHDLVARLVREEKVDGLRVDHVDGLHDPARYLRRLRERVGSRGRALYLVVEKILMGDEALPSHWPVAGTTGYDFATAINGVFIDPEGYAELGRIHAQATGEAVAFDDLVYRRKRQVITDLFPGELWALEHHLFQIAEQDRHGCDLPIRDLRQALVDVLACLPVYRTYTRGFELRPEDRRTLRRAFAEAHRRTPTLNTRALGFLARVLTLDLPATLTRRQRRAWLDFVMSWQQVTGPVTAKGLEDTALYLYNRFTPANEVGGDPGSPVRSPEDLHAFLANRQKRYPATMNATSTHDSKRSEDVRARLDALSELSDEWGERFGRWREANRDARQRVDGVQVPDADAESLLYQTLLGIWPFQAGDLEALRERVGAYMIKARREAKQQTSWLRPNEPYERALASFIGAILARPDGPFLSELRAFADRLAFYGALNSLAQVLLKIAAPGVPDFYQGSELWDLNLVDPDNRGPVDFAQRSLGLAALLRHASHDRAGLLRELLAGWRDGRIKLFLTAAALRFRRDHRDLFVMGEYVPLRPTGSRGENAIAFARRHGSDWALTVVPRLVARLTRPGTMPLGEAVWLGSRLELPASAPRRWLNVLTGEEGSDLHLSTLFGTFPVALLSAAGGR